MTSRRRKNALASQGSTTRRLVGKPDAVVPYGRVVTPAYARPRSPQPHFTSVTAPSSTSGRRTPPHSQAQIPLHSLARRGPRLLQGTRAGPLHPGQSSCRIASPSRSTPIAPRNLVFSLLPIAPSLCSGLSRVGHAATAALNHPFAPLWPLPILIIPQAGGMSPLKPVQD